MNDYHGLIRTRLGSELSPGIHSSIAPRDGKRPQYSNLTSLKLARELSPLVTSRVPWPFENSVFALSSKAIELATPSQIASGDRVFGRAKTERTSTVLNRLLDSYKKSL